MKTLALYYLLFLSATLSAQALKMDVPVIALGENQNFQVLSFEALAQDKFSILYMQELPATVVGDRENRNDKMTGAYLDKDGKNFVPYSNRVLFLVRQTVDKSGGSSTNFWVIAIRELESDMTYTMYYPSNFVHPIIKDAIPVTNSLKNLDQVKGLSPREFAALTAMAKRTYGFYEYAAPTFTARESSLAENIQLLKSGFKELKAVLGKGDIPKEEKVLFKREVLDKVRLTATKIDKKDSVEIKLYMASSDDAHYDLLKSQTFCGATNPSFATALIYDQSLKVAGAYGTLLLKYKDATGASKSNFLAVGIDNNADPHFWSLDAGKNSLNSFIPWFSYVNDKGIFIVSRNQEKIFKPFYQHHQLKNDGSTVTLCPVNEAEVAAQKWEYMPTEQNKTSSGYSSASQNFGASKEDLPAGIFDLSKSRFLLSGTKTTSNNGNSTVTSYGNLSVMHIDGDGKIKESYELQDYQGSQPVYPRVLGKYSDKAYLLIGYPNKFNAILSEDKIETDQLENNTYRLVYMDDNECVSTNQFGSMLLIKTIAGNKYTMEFFPKN